MIGQQLRRQVVARFARPSCRGMHGHSHDGKPCTHDHGHSHGDEQEETVMALAGAPVNSFRMNMWVLACVKSGEAAIVDAGCANEQELGQFADWIEQNDFRLSCVLQTHAHVDHVLGLDLVRSRFGADTPIFLSSKDLPTYKRAAQAAKQYGLGDLSNLPKDLTDLGSSVRVGELEFKVFETPGHCPGHVGFYEPITKRFFGGDLLFQGSVGRTDFPESNPKDMEMSLATVMRELPDETIILPGHGQPTTIGTERMSNPFLRSTLEKENL